MWLHLYAFIVYDNMLHPFSDCTVAISVSLFIHCTNVNFLQTIWKIYVVAENRILKINLLNIGTSQPAAEVFLGLQPDKEGNGEIIGLSASTLVSSIFINIKGRGLFAYTTLGKLLWSAGPVIDQFGYRQGCRKNATDCYFTSVPVIDQCEASIYVRPSDL